MEMNVIEFGSLIFIGLSIFSAFAAYYHIQKHHRYRMEMIR